MPVAAADVQVWLGLKQPDATLDTVCAAVNAYVGGLPVVTELAPLDPPTDPPTAPPWPDDVTLGATMLAARMYRRRNSPAGVEAITESGAQYIARSDIDVARLLRIDTMTRPQVG